MVTAPEVMESRSPMSRWVRGLSLKMFEGVQVGFADPGTSGDRGADAVPLETEPLQAAGEAISGLWADRHKYTVCLYCLVAK